MAGWAQRIVAHPAFHAVVVATILLAGVLAGVETSPVWMAAAGPAFAVIDAVILTVFIVEIVLKLVAAGSRWPAFFTDGWNLFDVLVVAACLLPAAGPFAAVLRLARLLRLVRLVPALPKLQLLVGALLRSLSAMGYVSLLLALMFYVYAVAGVHLFAGGDPADFGSLPVALLSLFRVVTLDNWGDLFNRVLATAPALVVVPYFVSFIVLGTMIILNLFIGIVMNSMTETHAELTGRAAPGGAATADVARDLAEIQRRLARIQEQLQHPPRT